MSVTIFLLWQLVAGVPADVDAFLSLDQCDEMHAGLEARLKLAIAQTGNPELAKIRISPCIPVKMEWENLAAR